MPAPKTFITPSVNSGRTNVEDDGKGHFIASFGNISWFTNLDISKRHENLILFKRYREDPSFYPKYDSYDAINVDKVKYIPEDYDGVMGVPITFLNNYNPEQFEIIDGIGRYSILDNERTKAVGNYLSMIDRQPKYFRYIIRNLHPLNNTQKGTN